MNKSTRRPFLAALLTTAALIPGWAALSPAVADSTVVANVNGRSVTEGDITIADAEIGGDLGTLPGPTKRRVLVEHVIETILFAEAATAQKLDQGASFEERKQYRQRQALRDTFFDNQIKAQVTDAEAKKFYDDQVSQLRPQDEVKARHILVETENKAKELFETLAHGADFGKLAKENSKDPGTKDEGGDLGYFGRGQMVPQFEETAFGLKSGEVSQPIQTQFGWHLIKVDDRREKKPPSFDQVKDRIVGSLIYKRAQEVTTDLRSKAKIEFIDPALKKMVEDEKTAAGALQPKKP